MASERSISSVGERHGLLLNTLESQIFDDFPLLVQKSLAGTVLQYVKDHSSSLFTPSTVDWVLQCLGKVLTFPFEDHQDMIMEVMKLYSTWLSGKKLPVPLVHSPVYFKTLISQLGAVFDNSKPLSEARLECCKSVLETYVKIARDDWVIFTETVSCPKYQSKEHVLKVLLAISHAHLSQTDQSDPIHNSLCEQLILVLTEVWLRADVLNVSLWGHFYELVQNWLHRIIVVSHWCKVFLALTERVKRVLYGPTQGAEAVSYGPPQTSITLNEHCLMHTWFRYKSLIGDPNTLKDAKVHTCAIKGVAAVAMALDSSGRTLPKNERGHAPPKTPNPPDGNTVMDVVGKWLFDAILHTDTRFVYGKAAAYGALCDIFVASTNRPFQMAYLAQFYHVVILALTGPEPVLVNEIVMHSRYIFSSQLQGVFILVPYFVRSIGRILCKSDENFFSLFEPLRRECIALMGSLVCISPVYGYITFEEPIETTTGIKISTMADVPTAVYDFVQRVLPVEKSPNNIQLLLWLVSLMIYEHVDNMPAIANTMIKASLRLVQPETPYKTSHVPLTILEMLSVLAPLHSKIHQANATTIPSIVRELCYIITSQLLNLSKPEGAETAANLVSNSFYALLDWMMVAKWLFNDGATIDMLLEAIESARGFLGKLNSFPRAFDPRNPPSCRYAVWATGADDSSSQASADAAQKQRQSIGGSGMSPSIVKVEQSAQCLFFYLLNHQNSFPSRSGANSMSSMLTEDSEFTLQEEAQGDVAIRKGTEALSDAAAQAREAHMAEVVRYYVLDDSTIVSTIERASGRVSVIVRDTTGKYSWDFSLADEPPCAGGGMITGYTVLDPSTLTPVVRETVPNVEDPVLNMLKRHAASEETLLQQEVAQPADLDSDDEFPQGSTPEPLRSFRNTPDLPVVNDAIALSQSNVDFLHENFNNNKAAHKLELDKQLTYSRPHKRRNEESVQPNGLPRDMWVPGHGNRLTCKIHQSRLLLSHLGLFSLENHKRLTALEQGIKLTRNLKILDRTAQRESHKIGVIYVATGQQSQRTILRNEGGSRDYEDFLSTLGWPVELHAHSGFMGGLDPQLTTGRVAPYFANYNSEVIFHVPTMMPNNPKDPQQIHKKRHVGNDIVQVVWNDNTYNYRPNTITSQFNHVHIVINPLKCGLYQVHVHKKDKDHPSLFGPLQDGMILTKRLLGPLVRQTAVNANRHVRYQQEGYNRPFPTRRTLIDEIVQRFKLEVAPSTFFTSTFTPSPLPQPATAPPPAASSESAK